MQTRRNTGYFVLLIALVASVGRAEIEPVPPPMSKEPRDIIEAADLGDVWWIQHYLNAGADVNMLTEDGFTPLIFAVRRQKVDAVRLLLDSGADPSIRNKEGYVPRCCTSPYKAGGNRSSHYCWTGDSK